MTMPELPEVECLSRAIRPLLKGHKISQVNFLRSDLRGPIPISQFKELIVGERIISVSRRSKYMLWETRKGWGIIHLGMSGNVLFMQEAEPKLAHTHAVFSIGEAHKITGYLHYVDPRRFGWITCCKKEDIHSHKFFMDLGPEPLDKDDLDEYLWQKSRKKTVSIKSLLMNAQVVVGVGNIYANESLFKAGVRPTRQSQKVTRLEMVKIARSIKETLCHAIEQGGTSFRDFKNADGKAGYFALSLNVYGRSKEACHVCGALIKSIRQNGRASYYCPTCQR